MGAEVTVHVREDVDVSNAMVIVGAPTLGLVGTITTRYLIDNLGLELVGGLRSAYFPPVSLIHTGRPSLPIRMYRMEAQCGVNMECDHLVVVTTEFVPGVRLIHAMSEALIGWAMDQDCNGLVIPDGLLVAEVDEDAGPVRGVAARHRGIELLSNLGVEPIDDGLVSGLSAALLYDSERLDLNTLCLLSETQPEHPDARAAARIVAILDRIVPEIHIETQPLIEQAEAIEAQVQAVRDQLAAKEREGAPGSSPAMYT